MSVLFFGTVPGETQEQLIRVVPFEKWGQIFVGCSGSFRFEKVISATYPSLRIHSNEVSLLSCSLGTLAVGQDFPLRFTGRLAFIEDMLGPDAPFLDRVAAVQVAQTMARYRGLNPYAQSYFAHYQERFGDFLAKQRKSIEMFLSPVKLASFTSGDFRDQAGRAAEAGGGFICFPPTFRGDFEGHYRFLDQNTEWPRLDYRIWDPDTMEDLVDEQIGRGTHYCCLIERKLTRHTPAAVFRGKIRPIYIYTDGAGSSVKRGAPRKAEPLRYEVADAAQLTRDTKVRIVAASTAQMNFLKDVYLKKEIHDIGGIANYLVLLDGKLAGGFIYVPSKYVGETLYVLCDFSLCPKSRVSKLIIMLQTSATMVRRMEIRLVKRLSQVATTAYTNNAVSMKYRGLYELNKRIPATDLTSQALYYVSKVRPETPDQIYTAWWDRFGAGRPEAGNKNRPLAAGRPEAGREKRPLHGGATVQQTGGEHQARRVLDDVTAGAS
jgi:hypothetical protein